MFNAKHFAKPELKRSFSITPKSSPAVTVRPEVVSPWIDVNKAVLPQDLPAPASTSITWIDNLKTQADVLTRIKAKLASRQTSHSPTCPESPDYVQDPLHKLPFQCNCPYGEKPFTDPAEVAFVFQLLSSEGPGPVLKNGLKQFVTSSWLQTVSNAAVPSLASTPPRYLNAVQEGTDYNERVGSEITLVRAIFRLDINFVASTAAGVGNTTFDAPQVRLAIAYDRMPLSAQVWAEDAYPCVNYTGLMQTATSGVNGNMLAQNHVLTENVRYKHLHNKVLTAKWGEHQTATANQYAAIGHIYHEVDIDLHGLKTTWYNPIVATSILSGQLLSWVVADAGVATIFTTGHNWSCELFFKDDLS